MEPKEVLFDARFLQEGLKERLKSKVGRDGTAYELLLNALNGDDIDRLKTENVFFSWTCSPCSAAILNNVPQCETMNLITFDRNYTTGSFIAEEITALLLHEIGHAFNPGPTGDQNEFTADNFAKDKGFAYWIVEGLRRGISMKLLGFTEKELEKRTANLKRIKV